MRKELRSVGYVWAAVVGFAIVVLGGTSIGPVVYTFNSGGAIYAFDLSVALVTLIAIEFTARTMKHEAVESEVVDSINQVGEDVNQSLKKFTNIYESSPRVDYTNVETQPMKIVVE